MTKIGTSFEMRVFIHIGGGLEYEIFLRGVFIFLKDVVRIFVSFLFFLLQIYYILYIGIVTILTYIVLIFGLYIF